MTHIKSIGCVLSLGILGQNLLLCLPKTIHLIIIIFGNKGKQTITATTKLAYKMNMNKIQFCLKY